MSAELLKRNYPEKFYPLPHPVWNALKNAENMKALRALVSWEYQHDFDEIVRLLSKQALSICRQLRAYDGITRDYTNEELRVYINTLPDCLIHVKILLFTYRVTKGDMFRGKARVKLFEVLKPINNKIDFYWPSFRMKQLMNEAKKNDK